MAKPWDRKPLWELLYMSDDKVYLRAAVIIGHLGIAPFDFFDRVKKLPGYSQYRYENAVRDMTVHAKLEGSPPWYELTGEAKKAARILIGPAPDAPDYVSWWVGRMISVRQMREQGQTVEWATEPPVPLPGEKPQEAHQEEKAAKKPRTRKKKAG